MGCYQVWEAAALAVQGCLQTCIAMVLLPCMALPQVCFCGHSCCRVVPLSKCLTWAPLCGQPLERSQTGPDAAPPSPIMHRLARVSTVAEEGEDSNRRQQSVPASAFQSAKAQTPEQVCGWCWSALEDQRHA